MAEGFVAKRDQALVQQLAAGLGVPLAPEVLQGLVRYLDQLSTWNRKLDLTGAKTASAQVEVLLLDPLVLSSQDLVPPGANLIDVGTGAGSPALPLAILRPDLRLCCVEPMRKRVAFLRTAVGALGLASRVRVVEQRLDPGHALPEGGPFDVATSRATFAPGQWLEIGLQLASAVVVLGGSAALPTVPEGVRMHEPVRYRVPSSGAARAIGIYAVDRV